MAEFNPAEELDDIYEMEHWTDALTGGFHPKSYMCHYKDYSKIYIGFSNISRSTDISFQDILIGNSLPIRITCEVVEPN